MRFIPTKPTPEQCSKKAKVVCDGKDIGFACYYPQIGGYHAACVVVTRKYDHEIDDGPPCFDAYIWHDGEFPLQDDDNRQPIIIHHCSAGQFIDFGELILNHQEVPENE